MPTLPDLLDQLDKNLASISSAMADIEDGILGGKPGGIVDEDAATYPGGNLGDLERMASRAYSISARAHGLRDKLTGSDMRGTGQVVGGDQATRDPLGTYSPSPPRARPDAASMNPPPGYAFVGGGLMRVPGVSVGVHSLGD